eukprot:TRINITY_DN8106_c0_g1_i3.p1 TRINITY_DN8106_c0_g1~~TRINITY_DN8106_c0_g1_i3.p1  ORF type:complete len:530 (-),score=106.44 TRINITY_DN8106_c0_g1_i3:594-2183(-)
MILRGGCCLLLISSAILVQLACCVRLGGEDGLPGDAEDEAASSKDSDAPGDKGKLHPPPGGGWASFGLVTYNEAGCPLTCGGVPIQGFAGGKSFIVGCSDGVNSPFNVTADHMDCPVEDAVEQAGGHAGTFHKLSMNRIAKRSYAFDQLREGVKEKDIRYGKVEFAAYTEFFCIRALQRYPKGAKDPEIRRKIAAHPLKPFAVDQTFAPTYYGVCRIVTPTESALFLVMADMLSDYEKPCYMDLKFGSTSVEPDTGSGSKFKDLKHKVVDGISYGKSEGVRLAGYVVESPTVGQYRYPPKGQKWKNGLVPPRQALNAFFNLAGHAKDEQTFDSFLRRFQQMRQAWNQTFDMRLRSVGLSAMMVYECADLGGAAGAAAAAGLGGAAGAAAAAGLAEQASAPEEEITPPEGPPRLRRQGAMTMGEAAAVVRGVPLPKAVLIDYAHFYPAETRPQWKESDGVLLGLKSIVKELEARKLRAQSVTAVKAIQGSREVSRSSQNRKCDIKRWRKITSELMSSKECQEAAREEGKQ